MLYYICRRLGSGTYNDSYYSEMARYCRVNYNIPPLKNIIAHTFNWCLMKYDLSQAQHDNAMANLTGIFSFPVGALDTLVGDMPAQTRANINNKLQAIGFDTTWIDGTNTVREILQCIAHSIQLSEQCEIEGQLTTPAAAQNYNIRTLRVNDIPQQARQRINQKLQAVGIDVSDITSTTPLWRIIRKIQRQADEVTPREFGTIKKSRWFFHDAAG